MLFNASSYAEVFASLHYAVTAGLLGWPKSFEPAFKNKKSFLFPYSEGATVATRIQKQPPEVS